MTGKEVHLPSNPQKRQEEAKRIRERAIRISQAQPLPRQMNNGEEEEYLQQLGVPVANFTKGLPHDEKGEVKHSDYAKLLQALRMGNEKDFAAIPLDPRAGRKYTAPQTGMAFDLEGPDAWAQAMELAPRLDSLKNDAEMMELYWMALTRDVPFIDYDTNDTVALAAEELSTFYETGLFQGENIFDTPHIQVINPRRVFRGLTQGDLQGPYLSQFLLHEVPFGSQLIDARQRTAPPGSDYMTRFEDWLAVQRGGDTRARDVLEPVGTRRFIRNLRDLARYVHVDQLHQAYFNAALLLLSANNAQPDDGNPYVSANTSGKNQDGFGVFGPPALLTLLTEVASRALKAVWFQKWFVHRRLRPEEWGGRIDVFRRGLVSRYPVSQRLLDSAAHRHILEKFGSSLLPQAFPEGSPMHPAYGTGHGTVAGACVTILKAWFDGGQRLVDLRRADGSPVLPLQVPAADGRSLVDYTGGDAGQLTVEGELNKLAANIAMGRNGAGIHWRSDYTQSLLLGEKVALGILQEQSILYNEDNHFTVVAFDGRHLRIQDGKLKVIFTPPKLAANGASAQGVSEASASPA
jgi:hypothetical protein